MENDSRAVRPADQMSEGNRIAQLPPPKLVDSEPLFGSMLAALEQEPALALDTESDSLYRYFYKVCLIQISSASADYLVDPLRLPDISPLGELLASPRIHKVMHAAENDVAVLKRDFKFEFSNVFDTMIAARILGGGPVGLAALLAQHFNVRLDKRVQLTDWGHRPLTPEQLSYGRLDSHYLLPLRAILHEQLEARGRWREAQEAFAALSTLPAAERLFDPDGFWRMRDARTLGPQELAVLRELYLWRDEQARNMNLPPFKVLDDRALLYLSRTQPYHVRDARLSDWQARRFAGSLMQAIVRGQNAPPPHLPPRAHTDGRRPDPEVQARFDRLRAWRSQRAVQRGVESDVVLNNETLMTIARAAPRDLEALRSLGILGPWKLEEYGDDLLIVVAQDGPDKR